MFKQAVCLFILIQTGVEKAFFQHTQDSQNYLDVKW